MVRIVWGANPRTTLCAQINAGCQPRFNGGQALWRLVQQDRRFEACLDRPVHEAGLHRVPRAIAARLYFRSGGLRPDLRQAI